jgi:hypothetical protein
VTVLTHICGPLCRTLNKSLLTDQQKWRDSVKAAEESKAKHEKECQTKVADMEAQVRDLMFHFDTQQKVEESSHKAELQVKGRCCCCFCRAHCFVFRAHRRGWC